MIPAPNPITVRISSTEERSGVTYYGIEVVSGQTQARVHAARPEAHPPCCFRRYTEFAALHTELLRTYPEHAPQDFPSKVWFPRSARVVRARQTALADFLERVLHDPFLRNTHEVQAFLGQLPAHRGSSTGSVSATTTETMAGQEAAMDAAAPAWLDRYRDVHQALRHWKQQLHRCDADSTLQGMRDRQLTCANIQREWARAAHLETELESLTALTPMEKTRRLNLLTNLRHEFEDALAAPARVSEIASVTASADPRPLTLQDQHRQMALQDQTAADLAGVLQRHKLLAQQMHESLQEHNARLDEMRAGLSGVVGKVDGATKNTKPFT